MEVVFQKVKGSEFINWFGPVLDALRQLGGNGRPKEVEDLIIKNEQVSGDVLSKKLKNGTSRFSNQVAFARQYLMWEGLIENNIRGVWELSDVGYNTYLNEAEARKIVKKWVDFFRKNKTTKDENGISTQSDSERIDAEQEYYSGVEDDELEEIQPFDPEEISLDTKVYSMDACLRRLEQGTIKLDPDFQRKEVWTPDKKSRLIESLMLKIPIPMFYVSADEKGVFSVVDGLQRLSTIRDFILGRKYLDTRENKYKGEGIKLNSLEFWGDKYNNSNFNELPTNLQNRILETEFTFTIINPGTPEDLKRNVFKRINTGGEPLTAMEIRHALYTGTSTDLLHKLSESEAFKYATDYSVKSNRMMDRELILRFLSFTIRDYSNYYRNNNMDAFLSDTMRIINIMPELNGREGAKLFINEEAKKEIIIKNLDTLEELFICAMKRAKSIFGIHTFRKSSGNKRRSQINKAMFEAWSVLLSKLNEKEFNSLEKQKEDFLSQYSLLLEDNNFTFTMSRDSWKYAGVQYRYTELTNLLNKFIHD